ncbi:hypothetical protein LF41_2156 [Lysobacter dokdonensis DS-58]|uniref:Uncharacterized protein n=1 Tax=Lysobacter dokdonensis DS-58 TaxID=1300345 RepID=A0A0A2WNA9_9GAMM|nr:hypothetical protein LF41_2156 [Lysobacter dokdonensis DS-58]
MQRVEGSQTSHRANSAAPRPMPFGMVGRADAAIRPRLAA